jgi:signal transduction histidine kinase
VFQLRKFYSNASSGTKVQGIFMTATEVVPSIMPLKAAYSEALKRACVGWGAEPETERSLRERIKVLEEMINERDLLVGIISHELRTPLTTIYGNAHLLLRLEDLDEDSRTRAINDIRTEAERLNGLVENMLLLARGSTRAAIPAEPIALDVAIGEVVSEHRRRFKDRAIRVSVKPSDLLAEGQPEYLRQVLQNLMGNAEKYSPTDQQIDVRARRCGKDVTISILDRGVGIDPAEAGIIFQAFYRSVRTASTVTGAGIGLAVCKLLVLAQSGRIVARPRQGGGAVFAFTLPGAA